MQMENGFHDPFLKFILKYLQTVPESLDLFMFLKENAEKGVPSSNVVSLQ